MSINPFSFTLTKLSIIYGIHFVQNVSAASIYEYDRKYEGKYTNSHETNEQQSLGNKLNCIVRTLPLTSKVSVIMFRLNSFVLGHINKASTDYKCPFF